jgi:carbamoylphosphate synthase small subunit
VLQQTATKKWLLLVLLDINACLILENGSYFFGVGIGKHGITTGELCFNTAMTGYQEVLSDPSYAGQIDNFCISSYWQCRSE